MSSTKNRLHYDSPIPQDIVDAIYKHCTVERLVRECSPRGTGKGLKTNKPKDGICAYVWRMARFNGGFDMSLPMMADFDLTNGVEELTGLHVCFGLTKHNRREVLDTLEKLSILLLLKLGIDPTAGTRRWGKAFGIL
jgi:hypothetical protein